MINAATAGPKYSNLTTALLAQDINRSQSLNFVATCTYPYLWVKFDRPDGFNPLMVGGTVPVIERFWDVRVAAAVIGYGLPQDAVARLPDAISEQVPPGMGAVVVPGVPGESS